MLLALTAKAQQAPDAVGVPGLTADYYRGYFYDTLSFFTKNSPAVRNRPVEQLNFQEAETDNFNIGEVATYYRPGYPDEFSGRFRGQLCITTPGVYTFYLGSDDAAALWLDGSPQAVAHNVGDTYSFRETSGTRTLAAGLHTLEVTYGEHGGSQGLVLRYAGMGLPKQLVPNGVLYAPSSAAIRPVLANFEVATNNQQVQLDWATTAELNSVTFVVEKSTDGVNFTELLRQPGAGTTTQPQAYQAFDRQPAKGLNYYRIQQIRTDHAPVYSPIKAVEVRPVTFAISVYPIPNKGTVFLHIQPTPVESVLVELVDVSGRRVYQQQLRLRDEQPQPFRPDVPTGLYILHITTSAGTITQKLPLGG